MSSQEKPFRRPQATELARRLAEPRRFIQVVAGARQVGKTTLVQQVTEAANVPVRYASADEPTLRGAEWIAQQWEASRLSADSGGAILVLDEVQKAANWSEAVKRLWDEDTRAARAQSRPAGLGPSPRPTRAHRKPRRPLRGAAPAALVFRRDARRVRLLAGGVRLLRRLSGCRIPRA